MLVRGISTKAPSGADIGTDVGTADGEKLSTSSALISPPGPVPATCYNV